MTDPAPNWYPDPVGAFEFRYWDGSNWTDFVSTAGVQSQSAVHSGPNNAPVVGDGTAAGQRAAAAPTDDRAGVEVKEDRRALLESAVKDWCGQLINLGGTNTLLYFRELKVGTLTLTNAERSAVGELLDGRTVALSKLFPDVHDREAAARRCRTVRNKAKENLEERGLRTLSIGVGMASWLNTRGAATPSAPVLLRSLVMTSKGGAEDDFGLALTDEWEINPTLTHLLKTHFHVNVYDQQLESVATDENGALSQQRAFELLNRAAGEVPDWEIDRQSVVVANFSYAKMPMVADLENSLEALLEHPLVCALAGSVEDRNSIRTSDASCWSEVDLGYADRQPPQDEFIVLDADASQCQVVNLAVNGANLVVQGPPGTGKSQTIANLISTLVARGKSVLFVAEKRAAIDAVLDRLRSVHLDDLVLDLHDGTGNRRRLATDLGMTLRAISSTPDNQPNGLHRDLDESRERLREHSDAMNVARDPWGISAYALQGELIATPDGARSELRLRGDVLRTLDEEALRQASNFIGEWVDLGGPGVVSGQQPWSRALGKVTTGDQVQQLRSSIASARQTTVPTARERTDVAIVSAGFHRPTTIDEAASMLGLTSAVNDTLQAFELPVFAAPIAEWSDALAPARRGRITRAAKRMFSGGYRKARKSARALALNTPSDTELLSALELAREQSAQWATYTSARSQPRAVSSEAALAAVTQLRTDIGTIGAWIDADLASGADFDDVDHRLATLMRDDATLTRLPRLEELRRHLRGLGLEDAVGEVSARGLDAQRAKQLLRFIWSASILEEVGAHDARIGAFDGRAHSTVAETFVASDVAHQRLNAKRVRRSTAERAVAALNEHDEQAAIVDKNARRKRGHLGVRELMQAAPDVLHALRPCWVMSPLVVAQLLPSDRPYFDVVVFDEASQIRPADAIPALARGRQAVVAGDSKQLPPTAFFNVAAVDGDDGDGAGAVTKDLESLLEVMAVVLAPRNTSATLNWHYRSRDERLIAFSNAQPDLYNWSLTTFPGAMGDGCLRHVEIPHRPGVGGTIESSTDEVAEVVQLVCEHARTRPKESLGVIAMGRKHADRIDESLRLARREDRDLDEFLDEGAEEPFFVKNLERVQGDERDAVILTIGYPKSTDGRMQYRFGPLNNDGGERRLNVAITRARSRMTVVSSFGPDDMDDARLGKAGAQMLKGYLAYARSGGRDLGRNAVRKPDLNGFEQDVLNRLTRADVPLEAQYGVAGYWIDFAAKHPTRQGEMVLAIEADGATYHSSETARQRDRLRRNHLENLGWEFHRIWSTDWFRNPEAEVEKCVGAYQAAVAASDARHEGRDDQRNGLGVLPSPPNGPTPPEINALRAGPRPIRIVPGSIDEYTDNQLDALCRWIRSDTLLRTDADLLDETMRELGFRRRGRKIVDRINASIARTRT